MKKLLSVLLLVIMAFCTACARGEVSEEYFPHQAAADRKPYSAVKILKDPNDPYSAVIEQYYRLVLDESIDAQDALKYSRYTIYDIDGDGTKELLLSCAHSPEDQMNRNMFLEHIFSVKDGKAFEVKIPNDQIPNWEYLGETDVSGRYVFPNGLIQINAGRNPCYFRYANGALSYVNDFVYKASETDNPYLYHYMCYAPDENGKRQFKEKMTYGDASDMWRELRDGKQCVDLFWMPLESYGQLKQAEDYYSIIVKDKRDELFKSYESNKKSRLSYDHAEIYTLDSYKRYLYAFYDIDGDGTQELLLSQNKYLWGYEEDEFYDSSIPPTKGIVLEHIYAFNGESIKEATSYNFVSALRWDNYFCYSIGGRDILTNGIVRYYGGSPEHTGYSFFRYSDGELKFINALTYFEGYETLVSDDNGKDVQEKITQKEFDRIKAEIEDGAKTADIQWQVIINYGQ